jgi:hypothetical protein
VFNVSGHIRRSKDRCLILLGGNNTLPINVLTGFKGVNPSISDDIATFYLHPSELQTVTHALCRVIVTKNGFKRILKFLIVVFPCMLTIIQLLFQQNALVFYY